jgi:DNA-binding transcriptional regulator YdaS (Cro superfamily)
LVKSSFTIEVNDYLTKQAMRQDPIYKAASEFGSLAKFAKLIGVSKQLMNHWANGSQPVPIPYCPLIECVSKGSVMRWDLRPNDWWLIWPELKDRADSPPLPTEEVSHG